MINICQYVKKLIIYVKIPITFARHRILTESDQFHLHMRKLVHFSVIQLILIENFKNQQKCCVHLVSTTMSKNRTGLIHHNNIAMRSYYFLMLTSFSELLFIKSLSTACVHDNTGFF